MKVSSIVQSSVARVAGVCVLGLGLSLGGCNKQLKEDNAALMTQNSALIAENNQLKTNQDAMTTRINALEQQAVAKPAGNNYDNAPMAPMSDRSSGGNARSGRSETIVVAGDVLFDSGQATVKAGAKKELDSIASRLRNKSDIRVEGYTDPKPIKKSKWSSNEQLSEARAEAVRKYLVGKGVPASNISAVGMGSAKPRATDKESRRVEIVVVE
ncbi:MAG: OmpA family protein [Phycisphaerales bacterium]|nr:OmpA family protein [Phycisphaerales bacterium]